LISQVVLFSTIPPTNNHGGLLLVGWGGTKNVNIIIKDNRLCVNYF
jgi:hypothetical protein